MSINNTYELEEAVIATIQSRWPDGYEDGQIRTIQLIRNLFAEYDGANDSYPTRDWECRGC